MKTDIFSNLEIPIDQLPNWEHVNFVPICTRYKNVIWINIIITSLVSLAVLGLIYILDDNPEQPSYVIGGIGLIVFFIVVLIINLYSLRRRGYAIREQDILYQAGILTHYTLIIPFKHIQHVKIRESFLGRMFKVAGIELFTSGAGQGMSIKGIDQQDAKILQQYVSEKISGWKGHAPKPLSEEGA